MSVVISLRHLVTCIIKNLIKCQYVTLLFFPRRKNAESAAETMSYLNVERGNRKKTVEIEKMYNMQISTKTSISNSSFFSFKSIFGLFCEKAKDRYRPQKITKNLDVLMVPDVFSMKSRILSYLFQSSHASISPSLSIVTKKHMRMSHTCGIFWVDHAFPL